MLFQGRADACRREEMIVSVVRDALEAVAVSGAVIGAGTVLFHERVDGDQRILRYGFGYHMQLLSVYLPLP